MYQCFALFILICTFVRRTLLCGWEFQCSTQACKAILLVGLDCTKMYREWNVSKWVSNSNVWSSRCRDSLRVWIGEVWIIKERLSVYFLDLQLCKFHAGVLHCCILGQRKEALTNTPVLLY